MTMILKKYKFLPAMAMSLMVAGTLSLSSCDLEHSDNGDLDGFWHLESIDSLENGHTADLSKQRVFWAVEFKLISARVSDANVSKMYFRFEQTSDSLKITQAYLDHGHQDNGEDGGDIPVEEVTDDLRFYGINNLPEGFYKEALDGSKMILRSKTLRLKFKKF